MCRHPSELHVSSQPSIRPGAGGTVSLLLAGRVDLLVCACTHPSLNRPTQSLVHLVHIRPCARPWEPSMSAPEKSQTSEVETSEQEGDEFSHRAVGT